MSSIAFTLPLIPQAKQRARKGYDGSFYTPTKTKAFETAIATYARTEKNLQAFDILLNCPINLEIKCYLPIPDSKIKKIKENDCHYIKPDCSNLAKSIEDGMNGIIYKDDCQISRLVVEKYYSKSPRIEIFVSRIAE